MQFGKKLRSAFRCALDASLTPHSGLRATLSVTVYSRLPTRSRGHPLILGRRRRALRPSRPRPPHAVTKVRPRAHDTRRVPSSRGARCEDATRPVLGSRLSHSRRTQHMLTAYYGPVFSTTFTIAAVSSAPPVLLEAFTPPHAVAGRMVVLSLAILNLTAKTMPPMIQLHAERFSVMAGLNGRFE